MLFDFKRKPSPLVVLPEGYNPYVTFRSEEIDPEKLEQAARDIYGPGELMVPASLLAAANAQIRKLTTKDTCTEGERRHARRLGSWSPGRSLPVCY